VDAQEMMMTTEDRFELNCKIVKKKMSYLDHQSRGKKGNETADVILLIPEITTESSCFYTAWLPDEADVRVTEWGDKLIAHSEIGMRAGYPIGGLIRGALYRANSLYPSPHIFIMSKKAEDLLQNHVGKKIRITVLGEQEFDEAYEAKAETKSPYSEMS